MPEAARVHDPVAHTHSNRDILLGVLAGAAIGVLAGVLIVGTGGLGAIAVVAGAGMFGGMVGGLLGESRGKRDTYQAGEILSGSRRVSVGRENQPAARAFADVAKCDQHDASDTCVDDPSKKGKKVAQGSGTVWIDGYMAARKGDKGVCDFTISVGCDKVEIGGPTVTDNRAQITSEVPGWVHPVLIGMGIVGGLLMAAPAVVAMWGAGSAAGLSIGMNALNVVPRVALMFGAGMGLSYGGKTGMSALGGMIGGEGSELQEDLGILGENFAPFLGGVKIPGAGKSVFGAISEAPIPGWMRPGTPPVLSGVQARNVPLDELRYSQGDVSPQTGDGTPIEDVAADMRNNGWDTSKPNPDVVEYEDGRKVTLDHRRLVAAQQAGLKEVPANVHPANEPLPAEDAGRFKLGKGQGFTDPETGIEYKRGDVPKTWGEAAKFRAASQRAKGFPDFPIEGSENLPGIRAPKAGVTPPAETAPLESGSNSGGAKSGSGSSSGGEPPAPAPEPLSEGSGITPKSPPATSEIEGVGGSETAPTSAPIPVSEASGITPDALPTEGGVTENTSGGGAGSPKSSLENLDEFRNGLSEQGQSEFDALRKGKTDEQARNLIQKMARNGDPKQAIEGMAASKAQAGPRLEAENQAFEKLNDPGFLERPEVQRALESGDPSKVQSEISSEIARQEVAAEYPPEEGNQIQTGTKFFERVSYTSRSEAAAATGKPEAAFYEKDGVVYSRYGENDLMVVRPNSETGTQQIRYLEEIKSGSGSGQTGGAARAQIENIQEGFDRIHNGDDSLRIFDDNGKDITSEYDAGSAKDAATATRGPETPNSSFDKSLKLSAKQLKNLSKRLLDSQGK